MAGKITSGDIFTPEQLSRHMKIYAGPGAGKTHFLVENIKNIVKTDARIFNSRTRKILCITYTNAAVAEIQRRLEGYGDVVEVKTIHGFIIDNIILPFQNELKRIIFDEFEIEVNQKARITSQIEGLSILHGHEREEIYGFINGGCQPQREITYGKKTMGDVQIDISKFLLDGITELIAPPKISADDVKPIKKFLWTIAQKLTHNEILYFGYKILKKSSLATYAMRVKFPLIFVDEFQDTNPLQVLLLRHLGAKSTIIGVIGDIAQSIYGFQGAQPTQFSGFNSIENNEVVEYSIEGNRRSTRNIVSLCNYLRNGDERNNISQVSQKLYASGEEKERAENKKVTFVVGQSHAAMALIGNIISDGGVVLTRGWADAFQYIQDISVEQKKALKTMYNEYYMSPVEIRQEIAEYNNVQWVRAFRFIILVRKANSSGSLIDALNAFALYCNVDEMRKAGVFSAVNIITFKTLLRELFSDVSKESVVVDIILNLNNLLESEKYKTFRDIMLGKDFILEWASEYDRENLKVNLSLLRLDTVEKLFTQVFSKNSKYMTVHQAKGLEWAKVIVGVQPNRFDKTNLKDMFESSSILSETPRDEFARIYYVACSRAKEELYIHLPEMDGLLELLEAKLGDFDDGPGYEVVR